MIWWFVWLIWMGGAMVAAERGMGIILSILWPYLLGRRLGELSSIKREDSDG